MRSAELNVLLLEVKNEFSNANLRIGYMDKGTFYTVKITLNGEETVKGFNNTVTIDLPYNYPRFVAKSLIVAKVGELVKTYEKCLEKEISELIDSLTLPEAIFLLAILSPDKAEMAVKDLINRS